MVAHHVSSFRRWQSLAAGLVVASLSFGCGDDDHDNRGMGAATDYTVDIAVTDAAVIGALQFEITHLGRRGGFIGYGDQVDCAALVDAIVAANYVGDRVVRIGLITVEGIRTPATILRCAFRTSEDLRPTDFLIEVTDASDTNSIALDPPPTVVVSSVVER